MRAPAHLETLVKINTIQKKPFILLYFSKILTPGRHLLHLRVVWLCPRYCAFVDRHTKEQPLDKKSQENMCSHRDYCQHAGTITIKSTWNWASEKHENLSEVAFSFVAGDGCTSRMHPRTSPAKQLIARDKSSLLVPLHDGERGVTKALPSWSVGSITTQSAAKLHAISTAKTLWAYRKSALTVIRKSSFPAYPPLVFGSRQTLAERFLAFLPPATQNCSASCDFLSFPV